MHSSTVILTVLSMKSMHKALAFQPIVSNTNYASLKTSTGSAFSTAQQTRTTALDMKVTINIDVDVPDFNVPSVPTDFGDYSSSLDSNAFSSMISSLTSFVSLPPPNADSVASTTPMIFDNMGVSEATYKSITEMNSILSLASFTDTSLLMSFTDAVTQGISLALTVLTATSLFLYAFSFPDDDFREDHEPYQRGKYDPEVARKYYVKHPVLVIKRTLQLLRIANKFVFRWLFDIFLGKHIQKFIHEDDEAIRKQQEERAEEVLEVIQKIGPTAIKVGQALSVRPDLISEVYTKKLSKLQDSVPPFDSEHAKDVLMNELGMERFQMLSNINLDQPVASASIGQVYRGSVMLKKDGGSSSKSNTNGNGYGTSFSTDWEEVEVAVKVQRPNVLSEIALDLFLTREFAPLYQKLTMNDTNLQKIADEWGRGFIAELTYEQEARNTMKFNEDMRKMNLNAVCAPTVVEELSTNRVLTTEWVRGERLDKSDSEDVARLCGVALNAYLVMLLETGTLHCGKSWHLPSMKQPFFSLKLTSSNY